jgi:nucleoside-diphosphate-sugar epimerase
LIVGCGDIGLRLASLLRARVQVVGTTTDPQRAVQLRRHGVMPIVADLDGRAGLGRLAAFTQRVLHLAPPPSHGRHDPRSASLLAQLRRGAGPARTILAADSPGRRRWVYVSTSGVYGDRAGARVDECALPQPFNDRAWRRLDAEHQWRAAGAQALARCIVLRVPGIYDAAARSPRERLLRATPVLRPDEDIYTNHIHADDLARIAALAVLGRGRPQRIYNASDDSELRMGEYFDLAARAFGLPAPPRISRADAEAGAVSAMQWSFMRESRRLDNQRMKRDFRLELRYPTPAAAFAAAAEPDADAAAAGSTLRSRRP